MFDPGALYITSWVILAQAILLLRYLWKRLDLRIGWLPLGGAEIVLVALFWCMCTSFLMLDFRAYEGGLFGSLSKAVLSGSLALGVILSFFHPVCAVCMFVSCLFLRPWELLSNSLVMTALPKGMAAICVLSWIAWTLRRRRFFLYFDRSCFFFIAFVLWLFISALGSGDMQTAVDYHVELFIPILVTVFLVLNSTSEKRDIAAVRNTVVICTLGVILTSFYLSYGVPEGSPDGRLRGAAFLGNANDLAALIMVALPLLVIPQIFSPHSFKFKLMAGLVSLVLMYGLWCAQSRGGMLALASAGATYFLLSFKRFKQGFLAVALLATLAFGLYSNMERDEGDLEMSRVSRWNYVVAGLGMAKEYPLMGVGIGNYPSLYELYTPSFDEWGSRTAHSTWILILAESGFVGFGLFALLYLSVFRVAWGERRTNPELLVSLVAYTVAMTFLSHSYLFLPYLLFAMILCARAIRVGKPSKVQGTRREGISSVYGSKSRRATAYALAVSVSFALYFTPSALAQVTFQGVAGLNKPIANVEPTLSGAVELSGSRGEIVHFLIKSSVPAGAERGEALTCSAISISSQDAGPPPNLNLSRLESILTVHPSFTGAHVGKHLDPAIPQPKSRVCIYANKPTWLVGEIWIPDNAQVGERKFDLLWDGHPLAKLEISLKVWKMRMPAAPALPAYMEMTTWWNLLGHYGQWREGEGRLAEKYFQEMKSHRVLPITAHVRVPEIELKAGDPQLDLKNRPTPEDSFYVVNLKHRPFWAHFGFPTVYPDTIKSPETARYFAAVQNTLPTLRDYGQPMIYLWDEPGDSVISEVKELASIVKKHAPGLKVMVTTPLKAQLSEVVDIFAPVMDQFGDAGFPGPKEYAKFRKEPGKEVWWYVSCMSHGCDALADSGRPDFVLDRPSVYIRSIAWLSMKYDIDAFLYFSVNHGFQHYPKRDPWDSVWDFSGNGDGTLFYPGRPGVRGLEEEVAVPALRLKAWREASFDAEYIRFMQRLDKRPKWWTSEFETLTRSTKNWSRDYARYSSLREKAGDYLNSVWEDGK